MAGIYLHIPFCKQACTYCDFHFTVNRKHVEELVSAMITEIKERRNYLQPDEEVETVYFGGGTPSVIKPEYIQSLLHEINSNFTVTVKAEITLECNPDDMTAENLKAWLEIGINRLSVGLQSFLDEELRWMNRSHTSTQGIDKIKLAQSIGFNNISVDLIYGSRFQDMSTWKQTIEKVIDMDIQHISAYNLTIESKTKLGMLHERGTEPEVNDDLSAEMYRHLISELTNNQFTHYETSNFSKEGYLSRHNSSYWQNKNYLGIGPSAHSYNGTSRSYNVSSNAVYISKIKEGKDPYTTELLAKRDKYNEYVLTRLRTMWGCDIEELERDYPPEYVAHFISTLNRHKHYFMSDMKRIVLNDEGKLMADFLSREFFYQK